MLATLAELTDGTMASLQIQAGTVDAGALTVSLVRPGSTLAATVVLGTLEVDLATGEVTGQVDNVAEGLADTLALAVEPGDIVQEPNLGLLVVSGVSTDGLRLDVVGASVSTSNVRKVGHVDMETLDL